MRKTLMAVPAALVIALSLSACGGGDGSSSGSSAAAPAEQTVEEACAAVVTEMDAFSAKYEDAASSLGSDPDAAISMLSDMTAEIKATGDSIGNAEVSSAWNDFAAAFEKLSTAAESQDVDGLTNASTELVDSAEAIGSLCPSAAE